MPSKRKLKKKIFFFNAKKLSPQNYQRSHIGIGINIIINNSGPITHFSKRKKITRELYISHETARVVILLLSYALLNPHPSPAPPKQERKVCFKSNFPETAQLRFPSIIDAHIKTSFPVWSQIRLQISKDEFKLIIIPFLKVVIP